MLITVATLFSMFGLGFVTGIFTIISYALYRFRKFDKERVKFAKDLAKKTKEATSAKVDSAKERIDKALDICEQQFGIVAAMERPQSGPLFGKHKQQMNNELKKLEEEKMAILRSVIADGYDPKLVTISENGERETIKLSDFIKRQESMMQDKFTKRSAPAEPVRKLSLVKNSDKENKE